MLLYSANPDTACENVFLSCSVKNVIGVVSGANNVDGREEKCFFLEENTFDCMTRITSVLSEYKL